MARSLQSRFGCFGVGCLLGVIAGVLVTLYVATLAVTQPPPMTTSVDEQPSLEAGVDEAYLNREITKRLIGDYTLGVQNVTLKSASIDLKPGNQVDLKPTFHIEAGPLSFDAAATVRNQVSAKDGKLVMEMVADPQLGNLDLPASKLPFDLNQRLKEAVNNLNNDLILPEVNAILEQGFGGTSFAVAGVTTTEDSLTITLQDK